MRSDEPIESSVSAACFGFFLVFPLKAVVFLALGRLPRSGGGGNSIGTVDIPWIWYAAIAYLLPILLTYFISLLIWRTSRRRMLVLVSAALATLTWYFLWGSDLLWRDYRGKF